MRWLKQLSHRLSEDRGATVVIVAVSLTALIGMAALAIDIGALYGERRQLQSGADAGALAIAEDCGLGDTDCASYETTADVYANSNAKDGTAGASAELNIPASMVTVSTETLDNSGDPSIFEPFLAQVIGFNGTTVNAKATAVWGSPSSLKVLPLIISDCEWILKPSPIYFHNPHPPYDCDLSPANQDLPGGFGWIDVTGPGFCQATVEVGTPTTGVDPGGSVATGCKDPAWWHGLVDTVVLIPFYDQKQGTGNTAVYRVAGFGAFHLTGYNFGGQYKGGDDDCSGPNSPGSSGQCVNGYFTTASVPEGELGGPNRGVVVVKLTE